MPLRCPKSAISGLAQVKQPNDRTEPTLPDAETDCRSALGPIQTVQRQSNVVLCAFTLHS